MKNRKLHQQVRGLAEGKSDKLNLISGVLGITINGKKTVEVSGREGYVFVRLRGSMSELIQAYNSTVSPIYDLPVLVTRAGNRYAIYGRDIERYNDWGTSSYLPRHGLQHSFDTDNGGGGDIAWIYPRQFMPMLSFPSGSNGAPNVLISQYVLQNSDGTFKTIGSTGTTNITIHNPTGSSAVMGLVFIDSISGNPGLIINSGSYFSSSITGSADVVPYIPALTNPDHIPDSAIRLVSGTSVLTWDNIYDIRQFFKVPSTGSAGSTTYITNAGVVVQDEGNPVGTGTTINFVGDNVSATINGSVVRVFVTGSIGGSTINTGTLDARYLKLDASNSPVTGQLSVIPSPADYPLYLEADDDFTVADLEQYSKKNNTTSQDPVAFLYREPFGNNAPTYIKPILEIWEKAGSGTFQQGMVQYKLNGTYRIDMNPSKTGTGTAYFFDTEKLASGGRILALMSSGTERILFHENGDVESVSPNAGMILHSPNGNKWRIIVDNSGNLSTLGL